MQSEMAILKTIQLELTKLHCRAFRTNVGEGWTGQSVRRADGSVVIQHARRFQTGLPVGFPDLLVILPNGRVVFMEVKTATGRVRPEQKQMHEFLENMHQHHCIVRSVEDAVKIIKRILEVERYGI